MSFYKNTSKIVTDSVSTPSKKNTDKTSSKIGTAVKSKKEKADEEAEKHRARVEVFQLWTDENAFKEQEYERRRNEKQKRKGVLKSDKKLQRWRKSYIPAIIAVSFGTLLLLCSSLDGLSSESIFLQNRKLFQILGGVVSGIGLVLIMITAAYTYNREDYVRHKHGFPTQFEASKQGRTSDTFMEEYLFLQNEFVDNDKKSHLNSSCNGRLSRMTSCESSNSIGNLGASFSSTSTAITWVFKHATRFQQSATPLRRQNSDTCLHQNFARTRQLSWNQNTEMEAGMFDEIQKDNNDCNSPDGHTRPSQTSSTTSRSSSGYHSSLSCPGTDNVSSSFTTRPSSGIREAKTNILVLSKNSGDFVSYDTEQANQASRSFHKPDTATEIPGVKEEKTNDLVPSQNFEDIILMNIEMADQTPCYFKPDTSV